MRNTPPKPPETARDSTTLLEDLCIALRDVAVFDRDLPNGAAVVEKIDEVRGILSELSKRKVGVEFRLQELSSQTHWRMNELLADCCGYPDRIPYVRGLDGIREHFRCYLCGQKERPDDPQLDPDFWMCDECLDRTVAAIEERNPIPGVFLYRSYNESERCKHADCETVVASISWHDDSHSPGRCKDCWIGERKRRRTAEELCS